jgi:hypothetical protein
VGGKIREAWKGKGGKKYSLPYAEVGISNPIGGRTNPSGASSFVSHHDFSSSPQYDYFLKYGIN